MAAAFYILLVADPDHAAQHIRNLPPTSCTPACSTRCPSLPSPAPQPSAGCWPTFAGLTPSPQYIQLYAGADARHHHVAASVAIHPRRRLRRRGASHHHIHAHHPKIEELGDINSVHMGVVIITTLVFGLITPPYGLVAADRCEIRRRAVLQGDGAIVSTLHRVPADDRLHRVVPRGRTLFSEVAAARIGGLLQEPERDGLHLPAIGRRRGTHQVAGQGTVFRF